MSSTYMYMFMYKHKELRYMYNGARCALSDDFTLHSMVRKQDNRIHPNGKLSVRKMVWNPVQRHSEGSHNSYLRVIVDLLRFVGTKRAQKKPFKE